MNPLQHLHIYGQSPYLDDLRRNEDEGVETYIKPFGSLMRKLAEARGKAVVQLEKQIGG